MSLPPTANEDSLLSALEETPYDDDLRAVLADWLEEHGEAEEAELVRVVLERKAMPGGAKGVVACSEHLHALAAASTWRGRDIVLCDPGLKASWGAVIDPPWTYFEPLRLGAVPSGVGAADIFVCVESYIEAVLRLDLYGVHGHCDAITWLGRLFIGYGHRVACVEPYSRGVTEIDLEADFRSFRNTDDLLFVMSDERVRRLSPKGVVLWESEALGGYAVEIHAVTDETISGDGIWENWEADIHERRPFRLDLMTGRAV